MCIAIYKPAGKIISEQTFRNCFGNNDDGAGFSVVEEENGKNELNTYKGIFSIEKFLETFAPHKEKQALIHFRIATHRAINGENCHPWRVNDELVFIHNGTIQNMSKNPALSDTGNFANEVLAPLAKDSPDFWMIEEFKWFIEHSIGSNNKLVLMNTRGDYAIFNEKAGEWQDGVWYSNNSFRYAGNRRWQGNWNAHSVYRGQQNDFEADFETDGGKTNEIASEPSNETTPDEPGTFDVDEVDKLLEEFQAKQLANKS